MGQRKKSLLIIFLILVLIPLVLWSGLEFFDSNNYLKYQIFALFPWSKGAQKKVGDVQFEIVSKIPGVSIDKESLNGELLQDVLTKLDLYPLKERPFINVFDENGQPLSLNSVSPERVVITLHAVSDLDDDKKSDPDLSKKIFYTHQRIEFFQWEHVAEPILRGLENNLTFSNIFFQEDPPAHSEGYSLPIERR